jgi:hypothetical protein
MKNHEMFKMLVTDIVSTRVAIEARAGHSLGLVDRTFTAITGDMIMRDWLAASEMTVDQVVAEICFPPRRRRKYPARQTRPSLIGWSTWGSRSTGPTRSPA